MSAFTGDYDPLLDLMNPQNKLFDVWGDEAKDYIEIPATSENPLDITKTKLVPREYAMDPIQGGQFLELAQFNGILRSLTTELKKQLIYSGLLPYNLKEQQDSGGYPLDAILSILYDEFSGVLFTPDVLSTLPEVQGISTAERRAKAQRLLVRSLKPNNTDSPLERTNLFTTWEVMDGVQFGETKDFIVNEKDKAFPPPPGYLDTAPSKTPEYSLDDYPRVKIALQAGGGVCGLFKKKGDDKFTIEHLGGLFPRVFNNNSTGNDNNPLPKDPGRAFTEIQDDSMGVITGMVFLTDYYHSGSSSYGDNVQRLVPLKAWVPLNQIPSELQNNPDYAYLKDIGTTNCFKPINISTSYSESSSSYRNQGIYYGSISDSTISETACNALLLDTSDHPKTSHEVRPKNFCIKKYVKV